MPRMVQVVDYDEEKNIHLVVPMDPDDELDLLIVRGHGTDRPECLGFLNTGYAATEDCKNRRIAFLERQQRKVFERAIQASMAQSASKE